MTMDYHHPYNVYPEYYCPTYQGSGYPYPLQQRQQQNHHQQHLHHSVSSGPMRNYNNNIIGPPSHHQHPHHHHHSHLQQQPQQQRQPYFTPFQQYNQQQQSNYATPYVPNFLVSSGTGLTPTLTPTTLANIEQTFLELQSAQQNGGRDPVTQSGFVPPVVDPGHSADVSQDSLDYSTSEYSDAEWEPKAKRGRMSGDIKNVDLIVTSTGTINAAPQRKYTRRNKDEKLPPEEEERRRVRRERNKIAAAKCRQRRVDHTNELMEETEQLENVQSQLESEIQALQQEKDNLEFILQAHQPLCKVNQARSASNKVKVEPEISQDRGDNYHQTASVDKRQKLDTFMSSSSSGHLSDAVTAASRTLAMSTAAPSPSSSSSIAATIASSSTFHEGLNTPTITSRPNSLPLIKRDRARMLSVTSATGVTINTPTSGMSITPSSLFCPGLDSMVDGSTGLTPLTGMSCSSQVQRSSTDSSPQAVGSPTLISL